MIDTLKRRMPPFVAILLIAAPLLTPTFYTGEQLAGVFLPQEEGWYYAASVTLAAMLLPRVIRWMPGIRLAERVGLWLLWSATVLIVWSGLVLTMIAHATALPVVHVLRNPATGGALTTSLGLLFGSVGTGLVLSVARALTPPALPTLPRIDVNRGQEQLADQPRPTPLHPPDRSQASTWQLGNLPTSEENHSQVANLPPQLPQVEELHVDGGEGEPHTTADFIPPGLDHELGDTVLVYASEGSYGKAGRRLGLSGEAVRLRVIRAREQAPNWVAEVLGE